MAKTGFLEESPGVKSSTRLGFLTGLFSVIIMAGFMVFKHQGSPIEIGTFLATSIAGVVGIKYFGTRNERPVESAPSEINKAE